MMGSNGLMRLVVIALAMTGPAGASLAQCPGTGGNCFDPRGNGSPGCDDVECCTLVCALDSFCCEVVWDALCAAEALEQCGNPVCGPTATNCDEMSPAPGCEDPLCCNFVCSIEPFCCDVNWDGSCVSIALTLCFGTSGACCLQDGTCVDYLSEAECSEGFFEGGGTTCDRVLCPGQGACCLETANGDVCVNAIEEKACLAFPVQNPDVFLGATFFKGQSCFGPQNCPIPTGACCFDDDGTPACTDGEVESTCTEYYLKGKYQGDGTTCAEVGCAVNPCPADTNGDGQVNVTDLVNVIQEWGSSGGPLGGDINGDGIVNVTDLIAVISAWGPCPD